MVEQTALSTIVESSTIDLAIGGWLDAHKKSARTHKAYQDTIQQFRDGLQRMGKDLDTDVQTLMLAAQAFARVLCRIMIPASPYKPATF